MPSFSRFLCAALVTLAILAVANPASAQKIAVIGENKEFGYFDLSTREYTQVVSSIEGASQVTSLAFNGNDLYITNRVGSSGTELQTVDAQTGALSASLGTIQYSTHNFEMFGMTFDAAGTLYGYDYGSDALITINTANAEATQLGSVGITADGPFRGRLSFSDGVLYGTMGAITNGLYRFDTANGTPTFLGDGGAAATYSDMLAFSAGEALYGISGTTLYQIDKANGNLATLGVITGTSLPTRFIGAVNTGAATAVPEVSSLALLGVAAPLLGGIRLMRRRRAAT